MQPPPAMRLQFWMSSLLFHLALILLCARIVRRQRDRLRHAEGSRGRFLSALREAATFGGSALGLAALGSLVVGPASGFTVLRLLSQALFGEAIVLSLVLAALCWRAAAPRSASALTGVAVALLLVYWQAYHREPHALRVRMHDVDLAERGSDWRALRIVHLTDLQTDRIGAYEENALREAMAQSPDLIVMTGDYIQPRLEPTRAQATADLKRLLRAVPLRAPLGVYAVRGDVDVDWPEVLAGTGITTLTGRVVRLPLGAGRHLSLAGLSSGMSRGHEDHALMRLMEPVPEDDLRIVIGHNPNFASSLAGRVHVDLALAGHTHGGQVVLPFFGPPITKTRLPTRNAAGLSIYEGMPLHVSRGIGMERGTAPQIRFLCPPEICVLKVKYAARGTRQASR